MKNINPSEEQNNCFICDYKLPRPIQYKLEDDALIYIYSCDNCKFYGEIDINTARDLDRFSDKLHIILGYLRDLYDNKRGIGRLTLEKIKDIINSADIPRNVSQKLDRLLLYIERNSDHPGHRISLDARKDYSIAYAKNSKEFYYLIEQLIEKSLLKGPFTSDPINVNLTIDGWNEIDQIRRQKIDSKQVFVAMWFNDDLKNAYDNGIYRAVKECGFDPVRVDLIHHNDRIDDRIIAEIKKSAFLIADFTGHRGGVYFEAGYAMGLRLPVIWLCKEDDIDNTHFDTRQYNHIVWEDENGLYEKLKARIEATIVIY